MPYWTGPCYLSFVSYKRTGEKDAILSRTLFSSSLFPTKEWRKGCHLGQDLVFGIVNSYKRIK